MKKLTTQVTITSFTNQGNENAIIQSVIAFINSNNLTCEKINDIQIELSEAINNIFSFAYPNKHGKVSVSIYIYDNKVLKLKVRDYGCGIEDITKAREPLFTTENERSGLGFSVMESFSDKLKVHSTTGKGTVVTMEFKL